VPADGASRAGAVAEQLNRTLAEGLGGSVQPVAIVCAKDAALDASEAIFIVADSSRGSLNSAREKISGLRSADLLERCALLLYRVPGGVTISEAEDITGLPLCSLVETEYQIAQLGRWLLANAPQAGAALAAAV
jgi:hypothetical protein